MRSVGLSCSAMRYDPQVVAALELKETYGKLLSADIWGACELHPGNPGLLHYGIHGVEVLYALLGKGCREVRLVRVKAGEIATALWSNGHYSTVRGIRDGQYGFGFVAHYENGNRPFMIEGAAFYRDLLKVFVTMCETGNPPIDYTEIRELIAFIQCADGSAATLGVPVSMGSDSPRGTS